MDVSFKIAWTNSETDVSSLPVNLESAPTVLAKTGILLSFNKLTKASRSSWLNAFPSFTIAVEQHACHENTVIPIPALRTPRGEAWRLSYGQALSNVGDSI